jgi:hypothetical protein
VARYGGAIRVTRGKAAKLLIRDRVAAEVLTGKSGCPGGSVQLRQRSLQLFRMKPEGAWTTLVNYAATFINQINPIGPAGISLLCDVIETINERGKFDAELPHAHARNLLALANVLWTGEDDLIANVALHLPNIAGMRFQDVNSVELHTLTIVVVELVKRGNLPPKWRSGVTAKDEHDRLVITKRGQVDLRGLIKRS